MRVVVKRQGCVAAFACGALLVANTWAAATETAPSPAPPKKGATKIAPPPAAGRKAKSDALRSAGQSKGKQATAEPDEKKPAAKPDGKWTFGGAVRVRATTNFNDAHRSNGKRATKNYFGIDAVILKGAYDSSTFFGAAQYNIYGGAYPYTRRAGYDSDFGDVSFLKFAYAGIKLNAIDSVSVGLQQVPFGLTPYFGASFIETLAYVAGVEEVYNVGMKFSHKGETFSYDLGYFPTDGGDYFGISRDSARYTTNIVKADSYLLGGSDNRERNMLVGRGEYTVYRDNVSNVMFGASALWSEIHNDDTGDVGHKWQEAVHMKATRGPWTVQGVATRLDIDAKNPLGQNDLITMGSFDGSYNVATKGWIVSGEVSYSFKPAFGEISEIMPYLNYSAFYKDKNAFKNSERYILGAAISVRKIPGLAIYPELRVGKNDPYTGFGQYGQGLGAGGDDRWKSTILTNVGYYF